MSEERSIQRVLSGESWADFCEGLKAAGAVILREASPRDPLDRAEGFRYLTRLARTALEQQLEFADPAAPVFRRPSHETIKIGADNPDNHYQSAAISGAAEYVIRGRRNSVHYLGIGSYVGGYGSSGRSGQTGYIDDGTLRLRPDGSFEIAVCCEKRPGNWLPLEPDSSTLIVRQTYQSRARERIADLTIERVGGPSPPAGLTPEALDRALGAAAAYVRGTATLFTDWAEGFAQRKNELPRFDPKVAAAAHGDPNIVYYHGYWELAEDEQLWIEVTPPACDYWNFQVNNHWMESLDYRWHRIALNHSEAQLEPNGELRVVLAHSDPGHPNWLETAGHRRGTMCLRWIGAKTHPDPAARVVKAGRRASGAVRR